MIVFLFEYYSFILKLYDAESISGFKNIHGRKGKALVHVGPVDSTITFDDCQKIVKSIFLDRHTCPIFVI